MMASERRRRPRRTFFSALLAITLLPSVALAEPTPPEKEKARELMAQGRSERDTNNLASALQRFQAADAIMHVPTTSYEVARTQQLMGLLVEAQETAAAVAKLPVMPTDPPPFAEARQKADALAKELAVQIPSLKVAVTSSDPSVTPSLTIDDRPQPISTTPHRLNPGRHVVVAKGGGAEARETVLLVASELKDVELHLNVPKKTIDTSVPQPESKGKIPLYSWVGFGVGAAGLVVGGVTGVMVLSQESDLATNCPDKQCVRKYEGDVDSATTLATVSTIGFIVAGVGAAVGVIGIVTRPKVVVESKSAKSAAFRITPGGFAGTF